MEAGQIENGGNVDNTIGTSYMPANPPAQAAQFENGSPRPDPTAAPSAKKRKFNASNQGSQEKDTPPSVSNCYVFKSRLQEYCQKAGLRTPAYETIKEGPSHEPSFRSTVIVNDVRYDSLPGFFNRKAAEQSAAEVALVALANSTDTEFAISQPVHETGLCKNLLQEYSQKMNYAIPFYECRKEEKEGRMPMYSCVVEIGGIKYIGASANTKKEAEIKAARTAMLAIKSSASVSEDNNSIYTVIPQKKKPPHLGISTQGPAAAAKPQKVRKNEKKPRKKRQGPKNAKGKGKICSQVKTDVQGGEGSGVMVAVIPELKVSGEVEFNMNGQRESAVDATDAVGSQAKTSCDSGEKEKGVLSLISEAATNSGHVETNADICSTKPSNGTENTQALIDGYCKDGESTTMNTNDMI